MDTRKGTRPSCAAGRRAAAVRAVAWDSEGSRTYPRFPVGIGGRHGRQVWDFAHGPSTRRQLRGPEETPRPKTAANHHALKRRIERRPAAASGEIARSEAAQFVELPRFVSAGACDCLLELEDGDGAKMRVRLRGVGMPDLAALGRSFWNRQP